MTDLLILLLFAGSLFAAVGLPLCLVYRKVLQVHEQVSRLAEVYMETAAEEGEE